MLQYSPKDTLPLGNFQGSGQHLDDCIAATSQFHPEFLHNPPPGFKNNLSFLLVQRTEPTKEHDYKGTSFHTPSHKDITFMATSSDVLKSLAL